MRLAELMEGQTFRRLAGTLDTLVGGLTHDSRRVGPESAFFCLPGKRHDGHEFAGEAVSRGAVAVVAERPLPSLPATPTGRPPTCLIVPDARLSLALAAATLWGHPSARLRLCTVTGTNGKTTVNHLTEAIFRADGRPTGLLGTVENRIGATSLPSSLTTPDALEVQASLAAMVEAGLTRACVEVSSHGLAGHRLAGCRIDVAVLTNIARDHLDFHESVHSYAATKLLLFRSLGGTLGGGPTTKPGPFYAVLNADDPFFDEFRAKIGAPQLAYGALNPAHVKLVAAILRDAGSLVRVAFARRPRGLPGAEWLSPAPSWPDEAAVRFPHPGRHNVRNLLAALTVAWAEGCHWEAARSAAEEFPGVRGRWEVVAAPDGVTGVVDFAHNPGGLVQALETARLAARKRVILVFGCEGQKDRGKRPVMGAIASSLADHVILTVDNTFHEDGRQILEDIRSGLIRPPAMPLSRLAHPGHRASYEIVCDRRRAIFRAAALARSGDLVVVAGRGHDVRLVFGSEVKILDDRRVLEEALQVVNRPDDRSPRRAAAHSHSMVAGGLDVMS